MQFIDLANQVIPGFELLSESEQNTFIKTDAGQRFLTVTSEILDSINSFSEKISILSILWGSHDKQKDLKKTEWSRMKNDLLDEIGESEDYKRLTTTIITRVLEGEYSDFAILTPHQKIKLANAEYSKILQTKLLPIEVAIREENEEIYLSSYQNTRLQELREQHKAVFDEWLSAFKDDSEMVLLRERIARFHARERINKLKSLLPVLNSQTSFEELSPVIDYIQKYGEESRKAEPDYDKMEEEFLTVLLHRHLQKVMANHIKFINLDSFNVNQANSIAKKLLEAANTNETADMDAWLKAYQVNLTQFIHRQLLLINGHEWKTKTKVEDDSGMLSSLSYLFWHSKAVNKTTEFFNKLADAHAFIQYTGMSTQNESSYLVLIDLYNYHRSAEQITETREILFSLFKPFLPLYQEYKEIGLYEKSVFRKVVRTVMPLIVIAAFVVLVAAMLSPLALPELAFLVAVIPTLFIGAYLATKYVSLKNELHQYMRKEYYGGAFEIPEFKINRRMEQIFGSSANAEIIRGIYIEELKICDEREKGFNEKADDGLLTDPELEARKKNITRRHRILLEWYDIHSNNQLGYEKVPQIVQNRLAELADEEVAQLQKDLAEHDLEQINVYVGRGVDEAKRVLAGPSSDSNRGVVINLTVPNDVSTVQSTVVPQQENVEPQPDSLEPIARAPENQSRVIGLSPAENNVRFFRPKSMAHQNKAAKLESAIDLINVDSSVGHSVQM